MTKSLFKKSKEELIKEIMRIRKKNSRMKQRMDKIILICHGGKDG